MTATVTTTAAMPVGPTATRQRVVRTAGWAVLGVGAVVLVVGWWFGVDVITRLHPSLVSMKANTAVGFMLMGLALLDVAHGGPVPRQLSLVAAGVLAALGAATVAEYAGDLDLGIDELLAADDNLVGTSAPGRMGLNTAIGFALLGPALLLADRSGGRRVLVAQGLIVVVGALSLLAFIGYLLSVSNVRGLGSATEMALHTSVLFQIGCVGAGALVADRGVLRVLAGTGDASRIARRLVPAATAALVVVTWFVARIGDTLLNGDVLVELAFTATLGIVVIALSVLAVTDRLARVEDRAEELEASRQQLSAFARSVAHDLKSPLSTVHGMTSLLLDDRDSLPEGAEQDLLGRVHGATGRMSDLINGLLEFAMATTHVREPVDLDDVGAFVANLVQDRLAEAGGRLEIERLGQAATSEPALRTILLNLVSNAIKYRDPERGLVICVRRAPDGAIEVVDNGLGVPEGDRERVFGVGVRVHGDRAQGAGIGLNTVRRIVDALGGRVWITDGDDGVGTTVHVLLGGDGT